MNKYLSMVAALAFLSGCAETASPIAQVGPPWPLAQDRQTCVDQGLPPHLEGYRTCRTRLVNERTTDPAYNNRVPLAAPQPQNS